MSEFSEKRKYPRIPFDMIVPIRVIPPDKVPAEAEGEIKNISLGGAYIESTNLFPAGAMVQFAIRVAPGDPICNATGIVRWCRKEPPSGFGIEFQKIGSSLVECIEKYIEKHGG